MSSPAPATSDLATPTALAAFLKGVERRAAVFAELQAGEPTLGDAALTRAMAAFRDKAIAAPLAHWPNLFWHELLAQPALRRARHARGPAFMPACSPPLRAALLLRLAAGLDEAQAAEVLGVDARRLRLAVVRALACAEGVIDPIAWTQLQSQVQQRIRELPTQRSLRLARMREAALAGPASRFFPKADTAPPRRRWVAPAIAAGLTFVALAGTYGLERSRRATGVQISELGPAGRPASRFGSASAMPMHPDFALLADPATEALAREAHFYSWLAAGAETPAEMPDAESGVALPPDTRYPESSLGP